MNTVLGALLLVLVPPQEDPKEVRARINDLGKQLRSRDVAARLEAVRELGGIRDAKARTHLARTLTTDTEAVRLAAAKALVRHRHKVSAEAIGKAIQSSYKNEKLTKALIGSLAELDMCAGIKVLMLTVKGTPQYGAEALEAIARIGCPEAVPEIVGYLKQAETEEKKPDFFQPLQNNNNPFQRRRVVDKPVPNKTKDKQLAALAPKVRQTLQALTLAKHDEYRDWYADLKAGKLRRPLVSVYYCEVLGKTFEVEPGARAKCPAPVGTTRHDDDFIKHVPAAP